VVLPYLPAFSVTPTQLEVGPDGAQLKISGNKFLSAILHVLHLLPEMEIAQKKIYHRLGYRFFSTDF
jgi:hypothetical protein